MTLFLNKLMHIIMQKLNYFKLSEDPDNFLFFHSRDFENIDKNKHAGPDKDLNNLPNYMKLRGMHCEIFYTP